MIKRILLLALPLLLSSSVYGEGFFFSSGAGAAASSASTPPTIEYVEAASVCTDSQPTPTSIEIDCRASTYGPAAAPNASGATMGIHGYHFSTLISELDPLAGSDPVPLIAAANTSLVGGVGTKTKVGNVWDAGLLSSAAVIDASTTDGMVSWLVESSSGTVREMAGWAVDASANVSYINLKYSIYQVNHNSMRVYENGSQKFIATFTVTAGDRLGIMIQSGVVTYVYIKGSVITPFYTSTVPATGPLEFQAAFNRGAGSSGQSILGDVQFHDTMTPRNVAAKVSGAATAVIDDIDKAALETVGLTASAGASYSLLTAEKNVNNKFLSGTDIDIVHWYAVTPNGSMLTVAP